MFIPSLYNKWFRGHRMVPQVKTAELHQSPKKTERPFAVDVHASQWWSADELEVFQNQRLRVMIQYAYEHIPGYRKKFDQAGVHPGDIRTKEDLQFLPITTRDELQENKDFVNESLIAATLYTGGSTGESLRYYDSRESMRIRLAAHERGWSWNGYVPGKRLAVISSAQGYVQARNTLNLLGDLTTVHLQKNVEALLHFQPQHLRGYVGSLYILARYCLSHAIHLQGIESINPISENLYPFQRQAMEEAFGCEVYEEYCCNDGGACAWECDAHHGLHYCMERAIIEDIDGEMIVTDLWNRAMPFIRYRNG
jgi:phenylacetate-CoA ligase